MVDNHLNIVGIRSKSANCRYFFSVECEDVALLRLVLGQVRDTLGVYGYEVVFDGRYHDG